MYGQKNSKSHYKCRSCRPSTKPPDEALEQGRNLSEGAAWMHAEEEDI